MTITLTLTEYDYLISLLYTASKDPSARSKRRRNWAICTILSFALSGFSDLTNDRSNTYFFLAIGIFCLLGYPFFIKIVHQQQYEKQAASTAKNTAGLTSSIQFNNDHILIENEIEESKIFTSAVTEINEIGTHILINIGKAGTLIIPKVSIDEEKFWLTVNAIIKNRNIVVNKELKWTW